MRQFMWQIPFRCPRKKRHCWSEVGAHGLFLAILTLFLPLGHPWGTKRKEKEEEEEEEDVPGVKIESCHHSTHSHFPFFRSTNERSIPDLLRRPIRKEIIFPLFGSGKRFEASFLHFRYRDVFLFSLLAGTNRQGNHRFGNHLYWMSWESDDPALRNEVWDWFNARNYCRKRCMDLVSIETPEEAQWLRGFIGSSKKYRKTYQHFCNISCSFQM